MSATLDPGFKLEDFRYVLPERTQNAIAFLSKKERETMPTRGTSRFDSEHIPQRNPNVAPNIYEMPSAFSMKNTASARVGEGASRFHRRQERESPSPASYNLKSFPGPIEPNKVPFNSSSIRKPPFNIPKQIPGVGTYSAVDVERDRRVPFSECFGTRKSLIPHVEVKCNPVALDLCSDCVKPPGGDYWQRKGEYLCRPCMAKRAPDERRVKDYKRVRDCGFMHDHERTTSKIHLMTRQELVKFQRKEAYFGKYF